MSIRKPIIFVLLFSALSAAFASQGSPVFQKAMEFYKAGEYDSTITVIRSHLQEHGRDPEAQTLVPLIVEAYIRTGQYQVIGNLVDMYRQRFSRSEFLPRLNYLYGVALVESGEYENAVEKFSDALAAGVNPELESHIIDALSKMCRGKFNTDQLAKLASRRRLNPRILEVIRFYTIKKQHADGLVSRAANNANEFLSLYPNSVYVPQLRAIAGVPASSGDAFEIGVMAPLSGDYRDVGKEIVQGIQVAIDNYNRRSSRPITMVVYDTESNVVKTAHRAKEIVQSGRVNAVIGPVLSDNATVSAVVFSGEDVLMLTPTASEQGLAALGDNIFQMNITLGTLGQKIARYAVENLNIRDFAVIAPDTYYGRITTEYFLNELKNHSNVEVVNVEYFQEGIHDFSQQITNLRRKLVRRRMERVALDGPMSRTVSTGKADSSMLADSTLSIGGIFMPVEAEDVVMLAPQLVFHRMRTQMLGSSGWQSDKVLEDGKRYVRDAIIATPFQLNTERSDWLEFEGAYRRRHNEEPGRVSALGYDAAQLLINAIDQSGTGVRRLQRTLSNVKDFQGLCGTVTFDSDSGANTEAPVMRIIENGFIRVQ